MTVRELRTRYAEVFGEETRAGNKAWLVKRIAWRVQSLAEGDLTERARQRAAELVDDADVRLSLSMATGARATFAVWPAMGLRTWRRGQRGCDGCGFGSWTGVIERRRQRSRVAR